MWKSTIPSAEDTRKAILQLDPDDDEAERDILDDIESRMEDKVDGALRMQQASLLSQLRSADEASLFMQALSSGQALQPTRSEMEAALQVALLESVDLGVNVAIRQLDNVGLGFDWTLANQAAREWARLHAGELIEQIDNTTRQQLMTILAGWIDTRGTFDDLVAALEPIFGRQRAELIASTEATRAYAFANRQAYREAGIRYMQWQTAADERVCPICGVLQGSTTGIDSSFDNVLDQEVRTQFRVSFQIPPAHPRCRCWIVPVI